MTGVFSTEQMQRRIFEQKRQTREMRYLPGSACMLLYASADHGLSPML